MTEKQSSKATPETLQDFDARLNAARKAQEPEGPRHRGMTESGSAWRMIIELCTGIGVGFGIGYGLDYVLGTMPVFIVIFVLLGFAAGVRVMIQTAKEVQQMKDKTEEAQNGGSEG